MIFRFSRPVSCKNQENGSGKQRHRSLHVSPVARPSCDVGVILCWTRRKSRSSWSKVQSWADCAMSNPFDAMPIDDFHKRWRRLQILQFCGDDRRTRSMHVLIIRPDSHLVSRESRKTARSVAVAIFYEIVYGLQLNRMVCDRLIWDVWQLCQLLLETVGGSSLPLFQRVKHADARSWWYENVFLATIECPSAVDYSTTTVWHVGKEECQLITPCIFLTQVVKPLTTEVTEKKKYTENL